VAPAAGTYSKLRCVKPNVALLRLILNLEGGLQVPADVPSWFCGSIESPRKHCKNFLVEHGT
jgi:hypothetical protein